MNEIGPENRRGDIISSLYVAIYLGIGFPIIGIGFGAEWIGLYWAIFIFACFITILAILMSILIARKTKKTINLVLD